jgi:RNA polymerase sigma-70 factor (ECF subfamily)
MDERALVERAQAGDADAFGVIVKWYLERVYRVAYGVVRNSDEAADIAQDTFVRAYRGIGRFDVSKPLFPWLYQIARNLGINRIQRVRNREATLPEFDTLKARDTGPEDRAIAEDESARVRAAVAALPEQHRAVIELNHFQECSYQEIAEILNIPIGTVMSRLYHARRKLREALSEERVNASKR